MTIILTLYGSTISFVLHAHPQKGGFYMTPHTFETGVFRKYPNRCLVSRDDRSWYKATDHRNFFSKRYRTIYPDHFFVGRHWHPTIEIIFIKKELTNLKSIWKSSFCMRAISVLSMPGISIRSRDSIHLRCMKSFYLIRKSFPFPIGMKFRSRSSPRSWIKL